MKSFVLRVSALLALIVGTGIGYGPSAFSVNADVPLFFTPVSKGQTQVLAGINSAKTSLRMTMFHLTDPQVVDALIAAKQRGVHVQVIVDNQQIPKEKPTGAYHRLTEAGVEARGSSPMFSITHCKSFTIDGTTAYIMTLNLTKIADRVRDVGYVTTDTETVRFVEELFATDWDNAINNTNNTPAQIPDHIVVSPTNSRDRLRTLFQSATKSLHVVVENLSYNDMIQDMIDAHNRGVDVQVLLPRCNISNADFNMPAAQKLNEVGIPVRMMPAPDSAETPYIHQKSIVVDGAKGFLGSENFSFNSIEHARELGILFDDPNQIKQLEEVFSSDYAKSLTYDQAAAVTCSKRTWGTDDGDVERSMLSSETTGITE